MQRYDEILEAIRGLVNNTPTNIDITDLLIKHGCWYLLTYKNNFNKNNKLIKVKQMVNQTAVRERFQKCEMLFKCMEENEIKYAVVKGAVLSNMCYQNPYVRISGDIDILIERRDLDYVKEIISEQGFVQGRIGSNGIKKYSREKLLFYTFTSHQIAPFLKINDSEVCPYIEIDLNTDILWGESVNKVDIGWILSQRKRTALDGIHFWKLDTKIEFICLCLHHYKDMNSIYLLYQGGLCLNLFIDIYFYVKSNYNDLLSVSELYELCDFLGVSKYVYYCLYYTDFIFNDESLKLFYEGKETEETMNILDCFGLDESELQKWKIGFLERLFDGCIKSYMEENLPYKLREKIKINQMFL